MAKAQTGRSTAKKTGSKGRAAAPKRTQGKAARSAKKKTPAKARTRSPRQTRSPATVKVSLHGAVRVFKKIGDAGHFEALSETIGRNDSVLNMQRSTFQAIRNLVRNTPALQHDAAIQAALPPTADDDYDPYRVYFK